MGTTARNTGVVAPLRWLPEPRRDGGEFCERYWPCLEPDDLDLRALLQIGEFSVDYGNKRCDTCVHLTEDGRCGWRSIPVRGGQPVKRLKPRECC